MANEEHYSVIKKGVSAWNEWMSLRKVTPDLRGANLRRADLMGANLEGANLRRADLRRAHLTEANLRRADLRRAHLTEANLVGTDLMGADLRGAYLEGTDLMGANFVGANFVGAYLMGANLRRANLEVADLTKANLRRANLMGANLERANLTEANLTEAKLISSRLGWSSLDKSILEKAIFLNVDIDSSRLINTRLQGLIVDQHSISQIPQELQDEYKDTWLVIDSGLDKESIIRSIEFQPQHKEAGMSILGYFGTVLRNKYKDMDVSVAIKQAGLRVTMIIEPPRGKSEAVERTLDDYGLVVTGEMRPEEFYTDQLQVMELKNQLRIAGVQLEYQKELLDFSKDQYGKRIESLEGEVSFLRGHVGDLLKSKILKTQIFFNKMIQQHDDIKNELSILSRKLSNSRPSEKDIQEVKDILLEVRDRDPGLFGTILERLIEFGYGVAGSLWASLIMELLKL